MIVAAMVTYYVVVCGLIGLVAYLTARNGIRRSEALADTSIARMREKYGHAPPLEPYVPAPLPNPPPAELRLAIVRPAGAGAEQLTRLAAEVIRQANRLEQSFGGDGLDYDPDGSVEEPERLVLRLVARSADWEAAERLEAVARELTRLAKRDAAPGDADLRARIDRELRPHLSPEAAEHVAGAVVC